MSTFDGTTGVFAANPDEDFDNDTVTAIDDIDRQNESTPKPENTNVTTTTAASGAAAAASRKRLCRFPGCERVIKSQGHCQRHGARAKRCRYPGGCDKQAQGTHEGMCKRHWRIVQNQNKPADQLIPSNSGKTRLAAPPPPAGTSVYEFIIPDSIAFRPTPQQIFSLLTTVNNHTAPVHTTTMSNPDDGDTNTPTETEPSTVLEPTLPPQYDSRLHHTNGELPLPTPPQLLIMPLVHYLAANQHLPAGWHRIHERRTRGVYPITSITTQLESWERQLAFIEICLLSGGTPQANFKHFCHAWGRDATFVSRLSSFICERRGELDRKKQRSTPDGTTAITTITTDLKSLKKTGVIIPRTTSLENHRKSIAADTMLDQPDVVNEPTAMMAPTVDTAVDDDDELEIDHESTSFLIQEEGPTTDVNPQHQPAHRGITEV